MAGLAPAIDVCARGKIFSRANNTTCRATDSPRAGLGGRLSERSLVLMRHRHLKWPALDRFNWALDYFDAYAKNNTRPALWIVTEGEGEVRRSFAELSERSNKVANFLRGHGWGAGGGYGPGESNYGVWNSWNRATIYQQALAEFSRRIAN